MSSNFSIREIKNKIKKNKKNAKQISDKGIRTPEGDRVSLSFRKDLKAFGAKFSLG